jgi:nucleoside-diphosphate-sugar epimerase
MNQPLAGKRIVLIGGAGFIGHNLALSLKRQGADVSVIDGLHVNNYLHFQCATGNQQNAALYRAFIEERLEQLRRVEIPLFIQDARDYHALSRVLTHINPEVIVHLAAVSHAGRSNKDPYSTFDHSLGTLENALDWARDRGPHFVFFSSSMVYGNFQTAEVDEQHPLEPIGIYGALKLAGEKLVIAYNQVFNLPYTIVRPSALYGQRCVSRRVGQIFIESALQGDPLCVDGDGSDKLDFTYIDDLVQGVSLVIEKPESLGETFNLTFGRSRTIKELVEVLLQDFPDLECKHVERDELMPFRGTLSVDKARDLLGYNPQFPIERGFGEYISWYKDFDRHHKFIEQARAYRQEPTSNGNGSRRLADESAPV